MYLLILALILIVPLILGWFMRSKTGWEISAYLIITSFLLALGFLLVWLTPPELMPVKSNPPAFRYTGGVFCLTLGSIGLLVGFIEFAVLRLIGLFRLGAIARITYYEALLQPFTLIIVPLGLIFIIIGAFMPFFTLSEDSKMYRDVATSLAFLFTVPVMIFASTKVIDEEIENRTMLTLMSKPVARWQVVIGKYIGVFLLCFAVMASLGLMSFCCAYIRFYDDMRIDYFVSNTAAAQDALNMVGYKALLAMAPSLLLQFLQIATLAAISVAISTRWGLAINIAMTVIIYMAANLARYAGNYSYILPGLGLLDISQRLIYGNYNYGDYFPINGLPSYSLLWQFVGIATLYSLFYIGAALSFGVALFRTRELS